MMTATRPILVLGLGCISAPGYGPEPLLAALSEGWSPPRPDPEWLLYDCVPPDLRVINGFDPSHYLQMRGMRPLSRASRLACVSAAAALDYPRCKPLAGETSAVVLGTQWGSIEPLVEFVRTATVDGPNRVNPSQFPNVVVNVHAGYLGILFGLKGPNVTLCGPGSGLEAIGHAVDLLNLGRADYALSGGTEALGITLLHGLQRTNERGSIPGEGAGCLLLGRQEATDRLPIARIVAWATVTAHNVSRADVAREAAIERVFSGLPSTGTIQSVWCSGTSFEPDESVERKELAVTNIESAAGVCRGAGGALAAVLGAYEVRRTSSAALVTDFPPDGPQTALLLAPP